MNYSEPVKQLLTLGEFQNTIIDYSELGISIDHAQELMAMATDQALLNADEEDSDFWAVLHAWYALGKLQITEAIPVLLELNDRYSYDYLFDDEFPKVFALMGRQAIPKLKDFIADKNNSQFARSNAMTCLERLGQDYRNECVPVFTDFLRNAAHDDRDLAGFAVCGLLELKAIESIDSIRDAFNRQCINIAIPGDIEDVEIDLGLRQTRATPQPDYSLDFPMAEVFQQLGSVFNSDNKSSATYFDEPITASSPKVGRNDPCPCGSGKKYKKCCLH